MVDVYCCYNCGKVLDGTKIPGFQKDNEWSCWCKECSNKRATTKRYERIGKQPPNEYQR